MVMVMVMVMVVVVVGAKTIATDFAGIAALNGSHLIKLPHGRPPSSIKTYKQR
jgi:hypothetical protein